MIIDLSGLRFMDSSALHVILRANRVMDRQGGVLALASPREPVAKMLRLTAADQLIPVYPSVREATAG
jgi:anti-anti-sigma factor